MDVRIKVFIDLVNTTETNSQLRGTVVFTEIRNIRHPLGSGQCEVKKRPGCHNHGRSSHFCVYTTDRQTDRQSPPLISTLSRSGGLCTSAINSANYLHSRSIPVTLRRSSAATRLLESWVQIPLRTWMFVSCVCCVSCR